MIPHKEIVLDFQKLIAKGEIRQTYEKYVSEDFKHHNVYFKSDRESLIKGMEENHTQFPDKVFEPKRLIEEEDLVVIHSRLVLKPGMPELSLVHIFRFENGKIVEMWDVGQQIPADSPNTNGAF